MKEKFTLFELLTEYREFYLPKTKSKTLKIYSITSTYSGDWLIDDNQEYFTDDIDDLPYHLLKKEVISAFYYDNTIEIFVK